MGSKVIRKLAVATSAALAVALFLAAGLSPAAFAADWPTYRAWIAPQGASGKQSK